MNLMMIRMVAIVVAMLASVAQAAQVWWEAEKPTQTNFPTRSDFSAANFASTRDRLSGADWLSSSGPRGGEELFAIYDVIVPADGTYDLWARKFWQHGPFRWRFAEQDWRECGRDIALADTTPLATNVCANWVLLGSVTLKQGKSRFELRLLAAPGEATTAAFDCFLLTDQLFVPNGKLMPGQRIGKAEEGYFPYEPQVDAFTNDVLLDLRSMNEPVAGQSGFIQRSGDKLTTGDGQPVRFWAVNVSLDTARQNRRSIDYLARRLAKAGVNLVRFHSRMFGAAGDSIRQIDPANIDDLQYLVSAMKKQGIYTETSVYFPLWLDSKPFAQIYFDAELQNTYRGWLRELLTSPNKYGPPLGQESAVAMVELVNEDSFFFWTFTRANIPSSKWAELEQRYREWLAKRYGSAAPEARLYEAWDMTSAGIRSGEAEKARRIGNQVRFLAELQRSFYTDMCLFIHQDLKAKPLIVAGNWTTSDSTVLDAIERWTYTAGDVMDRHGYFGGKHDGEGSAYCVRIGHRYEDKAAVLSPEDLPIRWPGVDGFPSISSEIGWTLPNRFRADGPFLAGVYGSVQGVDAICWFAVGNNYLLDSPGGKFNVSDPAIFGVFPAAALAYRRGLVAEASDVVHETLALDDLFAMKGSGMPDTAALDELRKKDVPPGTKISGNVSRFDPLAFYVGRVSRSVGDSPAGGFEVDISTHIDRSKRTIRSVTGQTLWDYGIGVARVGAPACQGACGFLSRVGMIELKDVSIQLHNDFGAVMVVPLDGREIADSSRWSRSSRRKRRWVNGPTAGSSANWGLCPSA